MTTEVKHSAADMKERIERFYQDAATRMQDLPMYNPALCVEVIGWQALNTHSGVNSGNQELSGQQNDHTDDNQRDKKPQAAEQQKQQPIQKQQSLNEQQTPWFGIVITPWSMLLWARPGAQVNAVKGSDWCLNLPAGECILTHAYAEETGAYASTSLISLMTDIPSQDDARTIAQEILHTLLEAPQSAKDSAQAGPSSADYESAESDAGIRSISKQQKPVMVSRRGFLTGLRSGRKNDS